jgi:hypothetical protein
MSDTFTLLHYPQVSTLISAQGFSETRNMPFNTTRKTIYKGVDSTLGFDVKNQDRKPINLLNKSVYVNLMNVRTGELIFQKRAQLVKPESGFCELTIFQSEIVNVDPGFYQISAVLHQTDGLGQSLYTDNNRRVTLEIEILDGAYPKFIASQSCTFTVSAGTYTSQPLTSNIANNDTGNLHTVQINMTNYTGTIEVEGTVEYNSVLGYFPITWSSGSAVLTYTNYTGPVGENFTADAKWIRIKHTPNIANTGTVDKVLYRS